ncbi:phospholipid carrier-dependent glycosyltransferase [Bradyrhizobium ontarionense]|uniref:Polyprenol-phosphate-mannose--protein mannosyltransferase n=1 Tax=Bradyrhizobium ontarionense TaxID=2898149 RepID=A0ABY3RJ34_9BRAD|nr:phospholipid carrier-dependent glycosyltransferase [Bradyrhizobium sp. A19]UFZ07471.1 phospholipid carrier-dependent glycosyltransferase [Bradyrhizobium sp. A19]
MHTKVSAARHGDGERSRDTAQHGDGSPRRRSLLTAVVIFLIAHVALMVGLASPPKFVFDEVHYVPAARQMLGLAPPLPQLNPMHPPLAKELIALSIRTFGDDAFGWRYPGTVLGALAVVAIYLCGLALFAAQAPAVAAAAIAFFNQMLFVQARTAMLDIGALAFSLLAIAAFLFGWRQQRPQFAFALAGAGFGLAIACKWSGLFPLLTALGIVGLIRLLQYWQTSFGDAEPTDWYRPEQWPRLAWVHILLCFVVIPALCYLATFVPLHGLSIAGILDAQRRIFADSVTTAIAGHTYMSAWPTWPFLVRPVWFLFDQTSDTAVAAVVLLGNPLVLWVALLALAVCVRDFVVVRSAPAFLILAFYLGCWLPWALLPRALSFLYYYLPSATLASLALVHVLMRAPRWLMWSYVAVAIAGFIAMLPVSAAFIGTTMQTFSRLMLFQSWI